METQGIKQIKLPLPPIWRILVCMAFLQLCGAAYVLSKGFFPDILANISYGAALATPTGFIFGFIWQAAHSKDSILEHFSSISILFLLSLVISATTVFFPISC